MAVSSIYFRKGLIDEALNYYASAVQMKPAFAVAHGNLGAALVRKGKIQPAIAQFNLALTIDPSQDNTRRNLKNTLVARDSITKEIAAKDKQATIMKQFLHIGHFLKYSLKMQIIVIKSPPYMPLRIKLTIPFSG